MSFSQSPVQSISGPPQYEQMARAAESIRRIITRSLGPNGALMPVRKSDDVVIGTRQGLTIARSLTAMEPVEQLVMRRAADTAALVISRCGDGAKTALLMFQSVLWEGVLAMAGHRRREVIRGMDRAYELAVAELQSLKQQATGETLYQVAVTAAGDQKIARVVHNAIGAAGPDGVVTITSGDGSQASMSLSTGMRVDRGYISDKFVTSGAEATCDLPDCLILITDHKIASMHQILPLLEDVVRMGRPLLLICQDCVEEALQLLITNHIRGTLRCAAVKAPAFGERRSALLEDIATITGGKAVLQEVGTSLSNLHVSDLGRAVRVVVDGESATIIEGGGQPELVRQRVELLRRELSRSQSPEAQERLQLRISNIVGKLAEIQVPRPSPSEADDAKYRAQSAMHSERGAIDAGVVLGGGTTLVRIASRLSGLPWNSPAERVGAGVIIGALRTPFSALVEATGLPMSDMERIVTEDASNTLGFNVEEARLEDLLVAGVLDSAEMVRVGLEVAHSQAKNLLLLDADQLSSHASDAQTPALLAATRQQNEPLRFDNDDLPF